jgi:DNA-binding transcriptional MerR regulator
MRIGELARASGVSVRALRHYDEIGLLRPAQRAPSGYRVYDDADVARLARIVALRGLGLSLDEVAAALDGHDVAGAVRARLARLDEQLAAGAALRGRLERVLDAAASADDLLAAIEGMTMFERHYTPDQLAQLDARRRALGAEGMARAEREWAELIAAVRAERERGTDPRDERMRELAGRWRALVEQFTGGDAGIERSLRSMYEAEGAEAASRGGVDAELMAYVGRALAQD